MLIKSGVIKRFKRSTKVIRRSRFLKMRFVKVVKEYWMGCSKVEHFDSEP